METEFTNDCTDDKIDNFENYRWQEYHCFTQNPSNEDDGLKFTDIELPTELSTYFSKVQQIEELKVTQV